MWVNNLIGNSDQDAAIELAPFRSGVVDKWFFVAKPLRHQPRLVASEILNQAETDRVGTPL